jgi:hypothetical protein
MTVEQLIELLQQMPGHHLVEIREQDDYGDDYRRMVREVVQVTDHAGPSVVIQ